ncbi:MAG: phosphotransferase [Cyanobacteria bacterium SZAS-4]|nr:phosphotransferase [Cyanobacteria bacterium SZAS-4]
MSTISFFGTLVDTIKAHYELPEILNVAGLPSLRSHAGDSDSVYQITTKSGASYVLRPFRTEIAAAIDLHNQFLHWTERCGFRFMQRIIQTRSGEDFFRSGEQKWWLSSYIEADPVFEWTKPTWSKEVCEQSGLALSSLHQALRQFVSENPSVQEKRKGDKSVLCYLEKRLEESFSKSPKFIDQWKLVAPVVSKALMLIRENESATEVLSGQLVHGDFHPGNLLFRDGTVVAVIDFEYLNFEDATYDLAYALVMFCTDWTDPTDDAQLTSAGREPAYDFGPICECRDGMIDREKLQAFLHGYLFNRAEFDLTFLIPYMHVAAAICLTWFLERELEDRTALHFINVVKQLENLSTMDISRAIGRASS